MRRVLTKNKSTLKLRSLFILTTLMVLTSCSNNDDPGCFISEVDFTNLEAAYSCENTKNLVEINLKDTHTIINTQAEFDAQISGPCMPQIDFDIYTLIIGKKGLANGNLSISYDYINNCATDTNTLTVTFNQNATTEAPNLTYHILSPKIAKSTTVEVDVIVTEN